MSRIDEIKALLAERGPMTVRDLAAELGTTQKAVTFHISVFRKYSKGIRVHSYDTTGSKTKPFRRYALGNKKDAEYVSPQHRPPSAIKRKRHPTKTRDDLAEMSHNARLRELAAKTQPFRDPMVWALFGGVAA